MLSFASDAGLDLVLGLPFIDGCHDDCVWDPRTSEELLTFTRDTLLATGSDIRVFGVELGEEMSPPPSSARFGNYLAAYRELKSLLDKLWPSPSARPVVLGPCAGMKDEDPSLGNTAFIRAFLNQSLAEGLIDGICLHSYNDNGGLNWTAPPLLNQSLREAETMQRWAREYSPQGSAPAPVWCGECGPHNHGGINGSTNSFLSSFWFMSALRVRRSRPARVRTARPGRLLQRAAGLQDLGTQPGLFPRCPLETTHGSAAAATFGDRTTARLPCVRALHSGHHERLCFRRLGQRRST